MEHLQSLFIRNNDVSWKILEDKCILLHLISGNYYTLNKVGRFLWESLDGKNTLGDICNKIVEHYHIDSKTVRNDITEIVQDLLKEGLVEEDETPAKNS